MTNTNEQTAAPVPVTDTTNDNKPSTERQNNNYNNKKKSNNNAVFQGQGSDSNNFEGADPDAGVVLGLRAERIKKKVSFDVFTEKISDYIIREYDHGRDIKPVFTKLQLPHEAFKRKHKPKGLSSEEAKDDAEVKMQEQRYKMYISRELQLEDNLSKAYSLVWGQCTNALQSVIKGLDGYDEKSDDYDVIWLLTSLKKITSGVDIKANVRVTLFDAIQTLFSMRQGQFESNDSYLERFNSNIKTLEMAQGKHVLCATDLMDKNSDVPTAQEIRNEEEKFKAILFLKRSDEGRYKELISKLQESSWLGKDEYPTTVAGMYALLTRHSGQIGNKSKDKNARPARGKGNSQGWTFAQTSAGSGASTKHSDCPQTNNNTGKTSVAGKDGNFYDIVCYNCDRHGHISYNCPEESKRGINITQLRLTLTQSNNGENDLINENWILLDTCSTVNVCKNASIITDVRKCRKGEELMIVTNGGSQDYNQIGLFKYLSLPIYYNPKSIANILSFKEVASYLVFASPWTHPWKGLFLLHYQMEGK